MSFPFSGQARLIFTLCALATLLSFQACHRAGSKEEKALRAELRQALRDRSFQRAAELARRASQARPQDNGNWDRLVQAEFGMRDLNAVKQTLQDWRRTVKKPSLNLEEYSGDLALEEKNSSDALQAWSKIIGLDPKNTRVLEKIARLEHSQHHWPEENAAWSASISVHEDAMARLHRALCRRHLHRWEEAIEDLHRAQELASDDAEV
ncbi:MAG: hypothetical protein M3O66_01000, partial [Verrucomicrobiota bacterium]|nr:hypothetical protein [Verrucomicrobiota bacterium]